MGIRRFHGSPVRNACGTRRFGNPRTLLAAGTVAFFLFTTVAAPVAEANFWQERRLSVRRLEKKSIHLADLPTIPVAPAARPQPIPSLETPGPSRSGLPAGLKNKYPLLADALPFEYGAVRGVASPRGPDTGRLVVLIQDVHGNLDAQRHISSALKSLTTRGGATLVALEGVFSHEGPSFPGWVNSPYPNRDVMALVGDYLIREGHVSGPVHAAITAPSFPSLVGVDDHQLYNANVKAYQEAAPQIEAEKSALNIERLKLQTDKQRLFNSALQDLDRKVDDYHQNKSSLAAYVEALARTAGQKSVPHAVQLFQQTAEMEKTLDFRQVEAERGHLLEALSRGLRPEEISDLAGYSLAYREGRVSYADFYGYLTRLCLGHGIPLPKFPAMDKYVRYVLLADRVDATALHDALSNLESRSYASLAQTEDEQSLIAKVRFHRLREKLADFSLTPEEWTIFHTLNKRAPTPFELFYIHAHARDDAMSLRLLEEMDRTKARTAVLVAGGYHAPGITAHLTKAGVTVVNFVPKIEKRDSPAGAAYLSVFNREKTPLEKLLLGEKLFLAKPPVSLVAPAYAAMAVCAMEEVGNGPSEFQMESTVVQTFSPRSELSVTAADLSRSEAEVTIQKNGWVAKITFYLTGGKLLAGSIGFLSGSRSLANRSRLFIPRFLSAIKNRAFAPESMRFPSLARLFDGLVWRDSPKNPPPIDSERIPWRVWLFRRLNNFIPRTNPNVELEKALSSIPALHPRADRQKPLVSILILNHKTDAPLVRLIDSLTQTVTDRIDIEIVVVDNESSNESRDMLDRMTVRLGREGIAATVIANSVNKGGSEGRNQGLEILLSPDRSRAPDYILTLDSDVTLDPYVIEDLVAWAEQEPPEAVAFAPPTHFYYQPDRIQATASIPRLGFPAQWELDKGFRHPLNHGKPVVSLATSTVLFRAGAFRTVGFFDPWFFFMLEDTEWFSRAESLGLYARMVPVRGRVLHDAHSSLGGAGSAARAYFLGRNIIFLARGECRRGIVPRKIIRAVYTLASAFAMSLLRGRFRSVQALFAGIWDGFQGRGGAGRGDIYRGRAPPPRTTVSHALPFKTAVYFSLIFLGTLGFTLGYGLLIDWGQSSFLFALSVTASVAYWGWAIVELLLNGVYYLVFRLVQGPIQFSQAETQNGLPAEGRTIIGYLLRSTDERDSQRTIANMATSYLANLDPNGRVTAVLISATAPVSIVRRELDMRDEARKDIETLIRQEGQDLLRMTTSDIAALFPPDHPRHEFWKSILLHWRNEQFSEERRASDLDALAERTARHFLYVHRSSTVLRKPGQYLDLMSLASRGLEFPYTYLSDTYGDPGRPAARPNFGFVPRANLDNNEGLSEEAFGLAAKALAARGEEDLRILLEAGRSHGGESDRSFRFTALADSDTIIPPRSLRQLVGIGIANPDRGVIQPSLVVKSAPTWYALWAVVEHVEPSVFSQGVFYALDRQGFFGKGVANNAVFLDRFFGTLEHPLEQTPLGILSHDTAEAIHLNPAFPASLFWMEDAHHNPIATHYQLKRWLTGDLLNVGYFFPKTIGRLYDWIRQLIGAPQFITTPPSGLEKSGLRGSAPQAFYLALTTVRPILQTPLALSWIVAMTFFTGPGLPLVMAPSAHGISFYLISMVVFLVIPELLGFRHLFMSLRHFSLGNTPLAKETFRKWKRITMRSVLKIMINPFIRIPEGPQRVVAITQAFWSVLSGRTSWKVQAEVDRETQHLTFRDVLKHVWYIPAIAVLFLIGIYARGEPVHFLLWTLLIPWLFSPFTTWFGSRNISPGQRTGRFYRWLVKDVPGDRFNDDEKPESNRTESRRNGGTSSKTGGSWLKSEFYKKWMAAPLETLGLLAALQLIAKNAVEFIGLSGFEGALVVSLAVGILAPLIYFYGHWFRNPEAMRDPAVQRLAWLTLGAGLLAGLSLMAPQLFTLFMVGALWLTDDHFRLNGGTDGRIEALLRDVPLNLGVGENPSHRLARGALFAETVSNMADADGIMRIKESLVLAGFSVGGLFESAAALRSVFLPGASVHFVHTGVSDTDLKSLGEAYALLHPQGGDRMRFVVPDKATEIRLAKHVPASAIAVALGATFIENAGRTRVNLALVEKRLGTWLSGKQELTLFSTTPLELSLQGVTSRALREAAEVFRLLLEALNGLPPSAIIQLRMIDKVAGAIMRSA